jgi:hypothetical protein
MPLLQWREFKREIDALVTIYRQDNAWVGKWKGASWNFEFHMYHYIRAAFRLYRATAENRLKYVLLGGTEIRKNAEYILQFGVTAANGIQDDETVQGVSQADAFRTGVVTAPRAQAAVNPDNRIIQAQGGGSILSERGWTPILNDALIIGSATAQHDFVIALDQYEQGIWRECEASLKPHLARMHARYAGRFGGNPPESFLKNTEEYRLMVWQRFFSWNMQMFWDTKLNIPRVLTRELLGLSMFGYEVKLGDKQIGFKPNTNAPDPTFAAYVNGLRALRMHDSRARSNIMQALSTYLLGDNHAIGFTADQNTVHTPPITGGQPIQFV